MNVHNGAYACPPVHPFRIVNGHVDATSAHRCTKVVVPPGAVDAIALIKVHDPRDILNVIAGAGHSLKRYLHPDAEFTGHGW